MSRNVKGKLKIVRLKLDAFEQKATAIIDEMDAFTFSNFENKFLGTKKSANDIFPFFDEYVTLLKSQERIKYAEGYESAKNSFNSYKKEIAFRDITEGFLHGMNPGC
jgi:hypothetical protein